MGNYSTVDRMLTVVSILGSATSITTGTLATFLTDAEAEVAANREAGGTCAGVTIYTTGLIPAK